MLIALLCFSLTARTIGFFFWWLGLCLLIVLFRSQQNRLFVLSWISVALVAFCFLVLTNALYLNPAYHAQGIYFPATLLIAFFLANCRPIWMKQTGFKLFCLYISLIAIWALVQWLSGWGFLGDKRDRAEAFFVVPNTLATVINLGLTPVLVYYLLGYGRRGVYWLTLLLFAALLSSQSRGGYLGLLVSLLFFVSFIGRDAVMVQWRRYRAVAIGFLAVLGFFKLYVWLGLANWSLDNVLATLNHGDSSYRWEIYQIAWAGLAEHLWLGIGYYNFGYYFEVHKSPLFLNQPIMLVHNDYLEFALETGLLGLSLFLLLIIAVYGQLFKFRRQAMAEQRLPLILSAVAITSMLTHALVDFPFYIPLLQAVFGAYLGIINQCVVGMGATCWQLPKMSMQILLGLRARYIGSLLVIGLFTWLGLPPLARFSADFGSHQLKQGGVQQGLYWHGVARALQPRDTAYYWREGIIWRDQGVAQSRPELLEKSDAVFSRGLEVNAFEINSLLERITLHRQYRNLLKQPASHQEIITWINYAKSQQPNTESVQMEYVRCLVFVGERAKAIEQAKLLVHRWPQSKPAQKLLESVLHDSPVETVLRQ